MVYRWHFHLDLTILQSEIVILIMLDQRLIVVGDIYKIVTVQMPVLLYLE